MYKIIIADDEPIECRALEKMIQEGMDRCQVIESVRNGLALVEKVEDLQPDIVIVDLNMPGLSGLDAIEILRRKKKNLKIIINTAYSDFAYIKRAMKYQVVDYLLKPVKREELYSLFRNICAQLDEEQAEAEKELRMGEMENQLLSITKNHFLDSLLLKEVNMNDLNHLTEHRNMDYMGGIMLYITVKKCRDQKDELRIKKQFVKCLEDCFQKDGILLTRQYQKGIYGLFMPEVSPEHIQNVFLKKLRAVYGQIEAENYGEFTIGGSEWKRSPNELIQAMQECQAAAQGRKDGGIYFFSKRKCSGADTVEKLLEQTLYLYSKNGLDNSLEVLVHTMKKWQENREKIPFSIMKTGCILCLMQIFLEEGERGETWIGNSRMKWEEWMKAKDYSSFADNLKKLDNLCKSDGRKEINRYVLDTLQYIKREYHKDLSLENVADYAGITPFYLSRLFRKELQAGFTEILTDIRMEKALELLWGTQESIKEVSERTGYLSLSYFYKVFKKYFGITAGELLMEIKEDQNS